MDRAEICSNNYFQKRLHETTKKVKEDITASRPKNLNHIGYRLQEYYAANKEEKRVIIKELSFCETIYSILDDLVRAGILKMEEKDAKNQQGNNAPVLGSRAKRIS